VGSATSLEGETTLGPRSAGNPHYSNLTSISPAIVIGVGTNRKSGAVTTHIECDAKIVSHGSTRDIGALLTPHPLRTGACRQ